MEQALVFVHQDRPVTDSLTVARVFEKEHKNVLRDIEDLGCSPQFSRLNFVPSTYVTERGREYPKYVITEQGFILLAMGYTGARAMAIKEQYIAEFDRMRQALEQARIAPRELTRLELIELARESELARLETEKQNAELAYQLRLQEPKVALYEVAMQADNAQPIGTVAKVLGIGPNKLFAFLREQRILMDHGARHNLPMQEYLDRGYFAVREYTITHLAHGIENKTQTLVTPKGLAFIHRLWATAHGQALPAVTRPAPATEEAATATHRASPG